MSRNLDDLNPAVRPLVDSALSIWAAAGIDILVTCTLRTNEEQAALYAQGRTAPGRIVTRAQAGQSAHNYGLAIDIVPMINGKPDWDGGHPIWESVGKLGQSAGLEWAGAPSYPFHELAHFQLPNWKEVAGV
jgi:peptidoglycan LD-endopeptidase CwlK